LRFVNNEHRFGYDYHNYHYRLALVWNNRQNQVEQKRDHTTVVQMFVRTNGILRMFSSQKCRYLQNTLQLRYCQFTLTRKTTDAFPVTKPWATFTKPWATFTLDIGVLEHITDIFHQ
jgi:hypothetical protein